MNAMSLLSIYACLPRLYGYVRVPILGCYQLYVISYSVLYIRIFFSYRQTGSAGTIQVNGEDRRILGIQHFLKLSCYIQQDDALRPHLTVQEGMIIAAHLKLGLKVPMYKKLEQVDT